RHHPGGGALSARGRLPGHSESLVGDGGGQGGSRGALLVSGFQLVVGDRDLDGVNAALLVGMTATLSEAISRVAADVSCFIAGRAVAPVDGGAEVLRVRRAVGVGELGKDRTVDKVTLAGGLVEGLGDAEGRVRNVDAAFRSVAGLSVLVGHRDSSWINALFRVATVVDVEVVAVLSDGWQSRCKHRCRPQLVRTTDLEVRAVYTCAEVGSHGIRIFLREWRDQGIATGYIWRERVL